MIRRELIEVSEGALEVLDGRGIFLACFNSGVRLTNDNDYTGVSLYYIDTSELLNPGDARSLNKSTGFDHRMPQNY